MSNSPTKRSTPSACHRIVVSVDPGTIHPYRACCVVAAVERVNSVWVMVEDGSELDGQIVKRPAVVY